MTSSTAGLEPAYVVDTHGLIWWLTGNRRLGANAAAVIAAAQRDETVLVLSAITLAELYYANRRNGFFDFAKTVADLTSRSYIAIHDFTAADALELDQEAAIPEMHDRIIAGLARRLGAPLLTMDPLIVQSGAVRIVW